MAEKISTRQVEVSAVVKKANEEVPYLELASTGARTKEDPKWLGKLVANEIEKMIAIDVLEIVIVTGIREPEVEEYLKKEGYQIVSISLDASPFSRYNRLVKAGKLKSVDQFLDREVAELNLGLQKVIDAARFGATTKDNVDPNAAANAIINHIKYRGLKA